MDINTLLAFQLKFYVGKLPPQKKYSMEVI